MAGSMGSHQSARMISDDWLTPPQIIGVLGPFDLDPCAAPEPRPWPTAARHVCRPGDGRLYFHRADGTRAEANAGAPSVLAAYGDSDAGRLWASGLPGAFVPAWRLMGPPEDV